MSTLRFWLARLWGTFASRRRTRELAEELDAHLALAIEEKMRAGMSYDEARRLALIESGGIASAREAYRDQLGIPALQRLGQALRHAARALRRSPGYAAAVVLSLALGVGVNTALFTVIEAVLLRPLPFADPHQLVAIGQRDSERTSWMVMGPDFPVWAAGTQTLESVAAFEAYHAVLEGTGGPEYVEGAIASPSLAHVLGVQPFLGRWFTSADTGRGVPRTIVLNHALWMRQFGGDSTVIGRTMRLYGEPVTVIGVMPPGVALPPRAAFWLPGAPMFHETVARLKPGVSPDLVRQELEALAPSRTNLRARGITPPDLVVRPLQTRLYGSIHEPLALLVAGAVLLLLLAGINVAALSLVRTSERRRELAVRSALGASRGALTLGVLAEQMLLATMAAVAGLLMAFWTSRTVVRLAPGELGLRDLAVSVNGATVLFAAAAATIVACLVSLAPALAVTRTDLPPVLAQGGVQSGRGRPVQRVGRSLVIAQLALALVLMVGAGLLVRTMARLTGVDLGFRPHGVVIGSLSLIRIDSLEVRRFVEAFPRAVRALPGVQEVTFGPAPLVGGRGEGLRDGFNMYFGWRTPREAMVYGWVKFVDPDYRSAFGLTLQAGRWLTDRDGAGAPAVAVINETAARTYFEGDAIGRVLENVPKSLSGGGPITVVGIVRDARQRDVTIPANPEIFVPLAQQQEQLSSIGTFAVRTAGDADALLPTVRRVLGEVAPQIAVQQLTTMQAVVDASLARYRFLLQLLGAFAGLALAIAVLGLYAVVSYLVSQRTREIGVRVALGARRRDVMGLVLHEGFGIVLTGIVIGVPAALAMTRLLSAFLYEISPRDLLTFAVAPPLFAAVAMVAALAPALRASRVDPVRTLRLE